MEIPEFVTRGQISDALRALDLASGSIEEVRITPNEVVVRCFTAGVPGGRGERTVRIVNDGTALDGAALSERLKRVERLLDMGLKVGGQR